MPSTETHTFTVEPGGSQILSSRYLPAARDGMVQSGMEGGMRETYDRLAELVQTI